jgi:hypothetical protein
LKRQLQFYSACMGQLHAENRTWTAIIDTDEYISRNANAMGDFKLQDQEGTTMLDMMNSPKNQMIKKIMSSGCIRMFRLRIGTKESAANKIEQMVPPGFNASSFQTLRWRWHSRLKPSKVNGNVKSVVDLSRVEDASIFKTNPWKVVNPHNPIKSLCLPKVKHQHDIITRNVILPLSPFVVHHYGGTFPQWSFRRDAREHTRKKAHYEQLQNISDGEDDNIRPWLQEFVAKVGYEMARALLDGVGELSPPDQYAAARTTK